MDIGFSLAEDPVPVVKFPRQGVEVLWAADFLFRRLLMPVLFFVITSL